MIGKELLVGVFNGALFALLTGAVGYFVFPGLAAMFLL